MSFIQKIRRVQRAGTYVRLCATHILLKPIAQLLYRKKHIWIVSERGTEARDNGYHLFRYIRENHPEQPVYYVIDKQSPDYPKVAALGNVVQRGSFRHWMLYLGAEIKISTHINGFVPDSNWHYFLFASRRRKNEKIVDIKHGIVKDDLKGHYRELTNITLYICGAKPEYDYVLSHYGYSANEVKYTGLARFDGLHDFTTRRQVLIMPTWRRWISKSIERVTLEDVESSTYLRSWVAFLQNKRLQELAEQYDVTFIFYPHYEMQPFLHLFAQESERVVIADFAHYDVQQLLKESMMLVTDFSSVFFDFAYMQKPALFYQFDEAEYRANHYGQGYFDYRRDGFGEVVTDEQSLLDLLEQYLKEGCRLKPEYRQRIEGFFPLHDKKNCERIYQEILKLQ